MKTESTGKIDVARNTDRGARTGAKLGVLVGTTVGNDRGIADGEEAGFGTNVGKACVRKW